MPSLFLRCPEGCTLRQPKCRHFGLFRSFHYCSSHNFYSSVFAARKRINQSHEPKAFSVKCTTTVPKLHSIMTLHKNEQQIYQQSKYANQTKHLAMDQEDFSSALGCDNASKALKVSASLDERQVAAKDMLHRPVPTLIVDYLDEATSYQRLKEHNEKLQEEVRALQQQLAEKDACLTRMEDASAQQLQHFAMMSHEIRTPLNGIIGLTSLLQAGKDNLTTEQSEAVDMIGSSGDVLLRVVNDVLDYAKLETGNVDISREETLLYPLLRQAVDAIRTKAHEREIKIHTSLAKNLPSHVYTDGKRIQQVLFNLLGNAVKFSRQGGTVEFTVVKSVTATGSPCLCMTVKDYGKGIEKSHFAKIFEPFQQADSETEQTHGGTGLGLTITSRLVKALGGSISVDSEVGKWCEFTVDLELEEEGSLRDNDDDFDSPKAVCHLRSLSSSASLGESSLFSMSSAQGDATAVREQTQFTASSRSNSDSSDSNRLGSFRVLIAEDNHINQMLVDRTLRRIGVKHIEIVGDGACAVERCNQEEFDLILMDQEMPVMNGMEATRLIRTQCCNSNAETKIIFVTAHATNGYEAKTLDAGADGFLPKPYKFADLKRTIETCFEQDYC